MLKTCTKCSVEKDTSEFPKGENRCRICRDAYMKAWADANREKINKNQLVYQTTIKGRASVLLNAAIKRAKDRDEYFNLTLADVIRGISPGYCQRTFFPFDLSLQNRGKKYHINPYSPSIDKIDPRGIYEPSNVQYVCSWYNLAKGQMSHEDLVIFCKRIAGLY
jgi:hypothetical protein